MQACVVLSLSEPPSERSRHHDCMGSEHIHLGCPECVALGAACFSQHVGSKRRVSTLMRVLLEEWSRFRIS